MGYVPILGIYLSKPKLQEYKLLRDIHFLFILQLYIIVRFLLAQIDALMVLILLFFILWIAKYISLEICIDHA